METEKESNQEVKESEEEKMEEEAEVQKDDRCSTWTRETTTVGR